MTTGAVVILAPSDGMKPRQQGDERKEESQRPRFDAATPAHPLTTVRIDVQHGFFYAYSLFSLGTSYRDCDLLLMSALRALPLL